MSGKVLKLVVALVLCVVCLSCSHFEPKPISPSEVVTHLEQRSLTNLALKFFLETNLHRELTNWPSLAWDFNTLTLAAFYYQPSLEVARAQWLEAKGGIRTASARPNPTVNFGPGYNSVAAKGVPPWMPFVNFDFTIETAGKRGYRIKHGQYLSEAARLNIATVAWQVRSNLRTSLLNFTAARQRETLLARQTSVQEKILGLLVQRLQAGAITSSDLVFSRIQFQRTQLDSTDAQRLRAEAEAML